MTREEQHRQLFEHLVQEFGEFGESAVAFLITAIGFVDSGDPERQPRLAEAISYCVREALKRILDSVERSGAGRWQRASRRVTAAKSHFDHVRGLPGGDEEGALAELLRTIDELDDLHNEAGLHERRIIAVLVSRTGAVPLEARHDVVIEYQALIEELNTAVHEDHDLESAQAALNRALRLLRLLFLPPDLRLAELDELALASEPTADDAARLVDAIYAASHLEYFFGRVVSARWLELLTDSGIVTPPAGQAPWPVYRLIQTLAESAPDEIAQWLDDAYDRWGSDPARARYLARAAADIASAGHKLLLRALGDHQQDSTICHTVEWALRDVSSSAPIVADVADYLLNLQSGLQRVAGAHRDHGVLGKMVEGVTAENAADRLRLLAYKLRSVPPDDWARRLVLSQRSGSIADTADAYRNDQFAILLEGFVAAINRAFAIGVGSDVVLGAVEVMDAELATRLRALVLATAPAMDLELAVEEVSTAICERPPHGDDLFLIGRVVSELASTRYVDAWRDSLGTPPSPASIASALTNHTVDERWLRCRDWSAILPEECAVEWKTALTLLAAAYGHVTRESFEHRPVGGAWTGQSPMTVDEITELGPDQAAAAIAAWRPDPNDWLVGARELARTLEEAVKRDPQGWLQSPVAVIGVLREPIYISHYFRAIAHVDADLSDAGEGLVEAIAFCRRHPWEPTVLGRDDWDYDPDWRAADGDGIEVLQKLANSDSGFGGHIEQAWTIVVEAARNRSDGSTIAPAREDPLETAINRPCTKALEAAISLMAFEFRSSEFVRPEGLELLDEALQLPGWDGAEHRAIIAPRLGFVLHIARSWVEQRAGLLFGSDAPGDLGQLTIDVAVKWGRPHRWVFEQARNGVLDAASRKVEPNGSPNRNAVGHWRIRDGDTGQSAFAERSDVALRCR